MKEVTELKRIMKERKLSLEKVARELGISSRTVFRWLHGESKPTGVSLDLLEKFVTMEPGSKLITVVVKSEPQKPVILKVPVQKSEKPKTVEIPMQVIKSEKPEIVEIKYEVPIQEPQEYVIGVITEQKKEKKKSTRKRKADKQS